MKKNLIYLAIIFLSIATKESYISAGAPTAAMAKMTNPNPSMTPQGNAGKGASSTSTSKEPDSKTAKKTMVQKAQTAAKKLYDAPGEISKAMGGQQKFITGKTGSVKSFVEGLDLSSFTKKSTKTPAKPEKSINVMKNNMKSSKLLTEDQKAQIDNMSDADIKDEYEHFKELLKTNTTSTKTPSTERFGGQISEQPTQETGQSTPDSSKENAKAPAKPEKSINVMKNNMKSSKLLTENQKTMIDNLSDAEIKEGYEDFQELLKANKRSTQTPSLKIPVGKIGEQPATQTQPITPPAEPTVDANPVTNHFLEKQKLTGLDIQNKTALLTKTVQEKAVQPLLEKLLIKEGLSAQDAINSLTNELNDLNTKPEKETKNEFKKRTNKIKTYTIALTILNS